MFKEHGFKVWQLAIVNQCHLWRESNTNDTVFRSWILKSDCQVHISKCRYLGSLVRAVADLNPVVIRRQFCWFGRVETVAKSLINYGATTETGARESGFDAD